MRSRRVAPWRQAGLPWPAVRTRCYLAEQYQYRAPKLLQLLWAQRVGHVRCWEQDLVDRVATGSCGEGKRDAVSDDEHRKIDQSLSRTQEFAIDLTSVRLVADEGAYAISGSVIGPCGGEARIRVWLGDPATGYKLREPTLGTETLVSGSLIVDLPGGRNVFSLVLDGFQLPANIPQPPSRVDPWVLTASAVGGEDESDPVLLPPPEYACRSVVSSTELSDESANYESDLSRATQGPTIKDPPPNGVTVRNGATYEIKGVQACSASPLLIEAWPKADGEMAVSAGPFATVLEPGETEFSILVKLLCEGPNSFVVRVTDLGSGMESGLVVVPKIIRKEIARLEMHNRYKKQIHLK